MKISCGIIGLPNVGKSTLFKLLTNLSVKIENFPFSTVQPNIATVSVFDLRLYQINRITQSKNMLFETIEFVDIAGLIKGASKGEGLGNTILHYMKGVKVLCHVVRCFDNDCVIHIENCIDPKRDVEIINTELILFDILQCEKYIMSTRKNHRVNHDIDQTLYILEKCLHGLYNGTALRNIQFSTMEIENVQKFNFLTFKPVIYIANVSEKYIDNVYLKKLQKIGFYEKSTVIPYCMLYTQTLQFQSNNKNYILNMIINHIISLLKLNTFFTVNINMVRAWMCPIGTIAVDAAQYVHSDFKRGFIRVKVIKFNDFIVNQGEIGSKKSGKIYFAGKKYHIQDGDILKFLFQK